MRVSVAVALADRQEVAEIEVREGATAREALERARIAERFPQLGPPDSWRIGIWSRLARAEAPLREGDRVEVYRKLKADPKAMRRARVQRTPRSPTKRGSP
jgi:putative ubiquitin-RnfH superfamily antitoxin RatB of RatAB toxin-antitoxin module